MGVVITKTNGGLGRRKPSDDMVSAIVMNGVAVSGGAQLLTPYILTSKEDAEALGLNAAYDTSNVVKVHYHIAEFFRMNPSGTLYLMLVAQSVTMTNMALKTNTQYLKALLVYGAGKIRQAAIIRNPPSGYTPVTTGGIDNDVLTVASSVRTGAIINAQALAEEEAGEGRPIDVILIEGRSINGAIGSVYDATLCLCPQVGVVVLADYDVSTGNALFNGMAAVGTVLGLVSAKKVGDSICHVGPGNIQSAADAAFINPSISKGVLLSAMAAADFINLKAKGYITSVTYPNYPGVYILNENTCMTASDDYSEIRLNRTINKAIRSVYLAMLPFVSSPIVVDPTSGQLPADVCAFFESKGTSTLEQMTRDGEISGGSVYVDPAQNLLTSANLETEIKVVPLGKADTISVMIGFDNPFNS